MPPKKRKTRSRIVLSNSSDSSDFQADDDDYMPIEQLVVNGHNSDTEVEEIDHAQEEEDNDELVDEDLEKKGDTTDEESDEQEIADKIELMGDHLDERFGADEEADSDSVLKSDQYFLAQSSKSKLSKHSFTTVLENFELYEQDIKKIVEKEHQLYCKEFNIEACSDAKLLQFYHLLKADFNLILYGFGSKRDMLIHFADQYLKEKYHYVVLHGYMESIKLKDVINIMNRTIGNDLDSLVSNETELISLMSKFFEDRDLFLLIHSIDVLYTKNVKIRKFIDNLFASVPNVRILATVDHANSSLLWSLTESATYRLLWFHMPTFQPYLTERKYSSSQSAIFTTGSKSWKQSTNLSAIKQVYESVNRNAQSIFRTILKLYLQSASRNSAFTFSSLYLTCREEFLVSSEVTMREHLAEFKYHNLIKIIKGSDGAESIQVTIDKDTVKRFKESIEEDG